ncbi:FAD-dependent oxidoreductase [Pseudonocardia oroxyli]|uniref:FAD binding domain-containing protein n=1 Tax=Pseudonocardia oroxyli TaxID=366584 RepID=A0A1G8D324_PSEOR|nr:FAD-dependent oxidoreductase [Pseudonocardia oroxyli]SDH51923.1 FAD binding domain-containing protein [Pseudonocardia oroxyli]
MTNIEFCDVLIIGSGAGGLSAAITAGHAGAQVIVVEAADKVGGTFAYSGGQVWVGMTDLEVEAGVDDSVADVRAYLQWLSQGQADDEMRETFVTRGPEVFRFLRNQGINLRLIRGLPDYYYPEAEGSKAEGRWYEIEPWDQSQLGPLIDLVATSPYGGGVVSSQDRIDTGGTAMTPELAERRQRHIEKGERCAGPGLAASMTKVAVDNGVTFYPSTRAVRLTIQDGKVTGAIVRDTSGERTVHARNGVIIATGAYDWSEEWMHRLDQLVDVKTMSPPTIRGDHFELTAPLDAAIEVVRRPVTSAVYFGTRTPGDEVHGSQAYRYYTPGLPRNIVVNDAGRRFADDAFHPGIAEGWLEGSANWPAWVIVDQKYIDTYGIGAVPAGGEIPEGMCSRGATIEETALAAGIDPAGLSGEVARWNGFCADGKDSDFGRGARPYALALNGDPRSENRNMGPITEAPFYAFPLVRVAVNSPAGGLVTGPTGQVRSTSGSGIPGLYAAGTAVAQRDIGASYNSGMGNQRGLLYGYLAALELTADGA